MARLLTQNAEMAKQLRNMSKKKAKKQDECSLTFFMSRHATGYAQRGAYRCKDRDKNLNHGFPIFLFHIVEV